MSLKVFFHFGSLPSSFYSLIIANFKASQNDRRDFFTYANKKVFSDSKNVNVIVVDQMKIPLPRRPIQKSTNLRFGQELRVSS